MKNVLALLILCWPLMAQQPAAQQSRPAFTLRIRAKASSAKLGSPIAIEVTLTNTSGSDLMYNPGDFGEDVNVWDERRSPVATTPRGDVFKGVGNNSKGLPNGMRSLEVRGNGNGKLLALKPKESVARDVIISDLFDFRSPGRYTLEVTRKDLDSLVTVSSNTIAVTLLP